MQEFIEVAAKNHIDAWLKSRGIRAECSFSIEQVGLTINPTCYSLHVGIVETTDSLNLDNDSTWVVEWDSAPSENVLELPDPRKLEGILWGLLPPKAYQHTM